MKRVASLYLPEWSIDLLRRAERPHAPLPERAAMPATHDATGPGAGCDEPRSTGWRPGARWARGGDESYPFPGEGRGPVGEQSLRRGAARYNDNLSNWTPASAGEQPVVAIRNIADLPAHQRPPLRELGRRNEAAENPYRRLPGDDGGKASGWPEPGRGAKKTLPSRRTPGSSGEGSHDDAKRAVMCVPPLDPGVRRGGAIKTAPPPRPSCSCEGWSVASRKPDVVDPRHPGFPPSRANRNDAGGRTERRCDTASAADLPLVTVHKVGSRVEVAAACPAARALGATPGMALTQLRAAIPGIAVRDADAAGDRAAIERLAVTLARRWTPVVAVSDDDGLFLDLSGVAHLHGGEARMMRRLVRGLARVGITARVGVADTTGAAWALARHAAAAVAILPPGDAMPALAPFPVAALRIGDQALDLLRRLGIDTVGALAALPRAPLARRFGRAVPLRLDQASGRIAEPLSPVVPAEPVAVEQRFAEPLMTAEPIAHWLAQLVVRLTAALAAAGIGARAVALVSTRVDDVRQVIRIGLARPTRSSDHLLRLLVRRIETLDPGFGIEALALHVLRADPLGAEALSHDLAEGGAPDLSLLVDAIDNRIGAGRLWRVRPVESDVPERAVARAAPLDPSVIATTRLKRDDVRHLDARPPADPWHPRWPRPVRLLLRPERIDHVMAEVPDYPPRRFTWRGVTHRVVCGDGPERITGEWWRRTAEAQAVRDYFRVEDDAGERFWLFRRGDGLRTETGDLTWYIHGTFG